MKLFTFYLAMSVVFSSLLSCESFVDDLNTDPNNPTDAPADLILTGAQVSNMYVMHMDRAGIIASMWSNQLTGIARQYSSYQVYQYSPVETQATWNQLYQQVYAQLEIVKPKYEEVNNKLGIGIAKVIQSHAIGTATAIYGDIPFSQAGNAREFEDPLFDSQIDVYADLQTLLSSAITDLESGVGTLPPGTDIYFDANSTKWIESAHTLKARFFLETREYNSAYDEALMGVSNPSNSLISPQSEANGMRNGLYNHQVSDRAGDVNAEGSYLVNILDPGSLSYRGNSKTDESARFNYYLVNLGNDGITGGIEPNYLSKANGDQYNGFIAIDAGYPLVTFQENLLTLAEAAARVKDFATALNHLNEFRSFMDGGGYIDPSYSDSFSLKYQPYEEGDFVDGGINNPGGMTKEQALLHEILEERYVTFFMQILAFNDVRRTRNEDVGIPLEPAIGDQLPERLYWGETESSSNDNAPPLPSLFEPTNVNAE